MSNEEKILEMLQALQADMKGVNARLDKLESKVDKLQADMDKLKEDSETTRGALNHLIAWSDEVSKAVDFPLPKS